MAAIYPGVGARYAKHVDNPDCNGRKLTVILYLNPGWQAEWGGGLLLYRLAQGTCTSDAHNTSQSETGDRTELIVPILNRLVVFWSDSRCPHEVRAIESAAPCPRLAITLWYFDNDELAAKLAEEKARSAQVVEWASCHLQWDHVCPCDDGVVAADRIFEHTARALFGVFAGLKGSVRPSTNWWRDGLLKSYAAALESTGRKRLLPVRWTDIVANQGSANEQLRAALVASSTVGTVLEQKLQ